MSNIKLFCIPYAGGSAAIYNEWKSLLDVFVELIPVELAGRGKRFNSPLYKSIHDAVQDISEQIVPHIGKGMYAVWGHSMGGVIAYELSHFMLQQRHPLPIHSFFSGSTAPNLRKKDNPIHQLPEEQFLKEIKEMNGTPREFFQNKELIDLYLPILRNDFMIVEQYKYEVRADKLNTNFSVLYGSEESFKNEVKEWSLHTSNRCSFHEFQGGHFFLFDHIRQIASLINNTLVPYNSLRGELIRRRALD